MTTNAPTVATLSKYPPYVSGHAMQAWWNDAALADLTGRAQHQVTYCGPVPAEFADPRIVVHEVSPAAEANPKVLDGHLEKAVAGTLVRLAREEGVDTFLTYYADPHATIAERARRTLRRWGRDVVVVASVEGSDLTDSLQRHVRDQEAAVLLADVLAADVLLVVSDYVRLELAALVTEVFGPEAADLTSARAVVRHPGLPPSWFVPAPADEQAAFRARHGIAADATVVSSYVRLVPEKGVAMLLDVAERLAVQRPGTVLVVGGDGRLEQELHAEVRARGLDGVRLLGHLDQHDAAVLRSTSTLGLFPSRPTPAWTETFGISPLEYEALGVPVVVTDIGGTRESTAHERFRLPLTADADAWARAASALLDDASSWSGVAREFAGTFTAARSAGIILDAVAGARAVREACTAAAPIGVLQPSTTTSLPSGSAS